MVDALNGTRVMVKCRRGVFLSMKEGCMVDIMGRTTIGQFDVNETLVDDKVDGMSVE
jgi:hypothetical protein